MKKRLAEAAFKAWCIACGLLVAWSAISADKLYALSAEQKDIYAKNILYYELACGDVAGTSAPAGPGEGSPEGTVFPKLDPAAMAAAIDEFIEKTNPGSKMKGLGDTIVAGGKASNVSPFLIVAIAQKESTLADPSVWNVRHANNAFGRTATNSQPHIQGAKQWYKWSSVKASVDPSAAENKDASGGGDIAAYIRNVYKDALDKGDFNSFFAKYAPPGDNNDTPQYIKDAKSSMEAMAKAAQAGGGGSAPATETTEEAGSELGCTCGGAGTPTEGNNNKEKIWNFLIDETNGVGLTAKQAAGVMGNIWQESKYSTTAENPRSKAYGIAQWYAGRRTALETFARSENKPKSDLGVQLKFLKKELEGSYKDSVLEPIRASNSIEEAAKIWLEKFEVPCLPGSSACAHEMTIRMPEADRVFDAYGNGAVATTSDSSGSEGGCTDAEGKGDTTGEFIWPLDKQFPVTACYGSQARGRLHSGLDISAPTGTKVVAADGGTVTFAGNNDPDGFGETIVIKHDNGLHTLYAHLQVGSMKVKKGNKVDRGQAIAQVNNSGGSRGAHLHFNVQKNSMPAYAADGSDTEDPLKHLPEDGRQIPKGTDDC